MTESFIAQRPTFYAGDNVRFKEEYAAKYPGVFRIERVNPRTLTVIGTDGRKVKTDPWLVSPTSDAFIPMASSEVFHLGTTVRFKPEARVRAADMGKTFVVIKMGAGTVNLAELNGDDDRYYRTIRTGVIEKVTP